MKRSVHRWSHAWELEQVGATGILRVLQVVRGYMYAASTRIISAFHTLDALSIEIISDVCIAGHCL